MPSETFEQLLDRAASLCGVEPYFWDIWGHKHEITLESKQALLRARGIAAGSADELEQSLASRARAEWERLLPPAVVVTVAAETELALNVPADCPHPVARALIHREDGSGAAFEIPLADLPVSASIEIDGRTWVRKVACLPVALPLGYHRIQAAVGAAAADTRYIVTPERAWNDHLPARGRRAAGVAVSLYGVRSERNWGCGDFRDLLGVIDWVADDLGASFVSLNPLHAIHNRRPFNTSPYLPNCIFYQNFIYLDVEGMEDFVRCARAVRLRASAPVDAEIRRLRETPFVEYEGVAALKLRFLKLLFVQFLREWRAGSPRAAAFNEFRDREGDLLEKFALYCALDEWLHSRNPKLWIWPDWPAEYRDPDSAATRAFRQKHWRSVMFYQYLQWQIGLQLQRAQRRARGHKMSIGLYHDLALATDSFGSDLWAHRRFFVAGCRVGSPPDDFALGGQDWGFPPPNAEVHRADGYRLFAETIRRNARYGGALRMDHVMRLFRLYWIPDGSDAAHGAYVKEVSLDFLRILALESVRNRVLIVGEDLGTVEPAIRETLEQFGVLSYRLFYFEKNPRGEFRRYREYPRQALVSSTTHDLPTLAGMWTGADLYARRAAGMLDQAGFEAQSRVRLEEKQKMLDMLFELELIPPFLPRRAQDYPALSGELHNAIVGFLALTPSQLLAINQEDLTKETEQQNLPGTTWQYPNWSRKMRFSIEQLCNDSEARGYTAMFRNWIVKSGRKNEATE
ncbi:MAG: 4-alpha-glucanotransferase [Bryobacteraceae bacterium]|jgi:4-alpha-glucanotransferase